MLTGDILERVSQLPSFANLVRVLQGSMVFGYSGEKEAVLAFVNELATMDCAVETQRKLLDQLRWDGPRGCFTLIAIAAATGDLPLIVRLIQAGVQIDRPQILKKKDASLQLSSALCVALGAGQFEVVQPLLQAGAVFDCDALENPLHIESVKKRLQAMCNDYTLSLAWRYDVGEILRTASMTAASSTRRAVGGFVEGGHGSEDDTSSLCSDGSYTYA